MTNYQNLFEGGTQGVGITTGNSGGTSGDPVSTAITAPSTATYDTGSAAHGSMGLLITPSSGTATIIYYVVNSTTINLRAAYKLSSATPPGADTLILAAYAGGTRVASWHINTAGKLRLSNAANTTGVFTASTALTAGTWVTVDLYVVVGTTTSNGTLSGAMYDASGNVIDTIYSAVGTANTGTANITQLRGGKAAASTYATAYGMDDLRASDTATGLVGPAPVTTTGAASAPFSVATAADTTRGQVAAVSAPLTVATSADATRDANGFMSTTITAAVSAAAVLLALAVAATPIAVGLTADATITHASDTITSLTAATSATATAATLAAVTLPAAVVTSADATRSTTSQAMTPIAVTTTADAVATHVGTAATETPLTAATTAAATLITHPAATTPVMTALTAAATRGVAVNGAALFTAATTADAARGQTATTAGTTATVVTTAAATLGRAADATGTPVTVATVAEVTLGHTSDTGDTTVNVTVTADANVIPVDNGVDAWWVASLDPQEWAAILDPQAWTATLEVPRMVDGQLVASLEHRTITTRGRVDPTGATGEVSFDGGLTFPAAATLVAAVFNNGQWIASWQFRIGPGGGATVPVGNHEIRIRLTGITGEVPILPAGRLRVDA